MSKVGKKVVSLTENELVDVMDKIVAEAVEAVLTEKKKEWLAEHEAKSTNVLEERIKGLEKKIAQLTEGKK
jgi:hypothetical protein